MSVTSEWVAAIQAHIVSISIEPLRKSPVRTSVMYHLLPPAMKVGTVSASSSNSKTSNEISTSEKSSCVSDTPLKVVNGGIQTIFRIIESSSRRVNHSEEGELSNRWLVLLRFIVESRCRPRRCLECERLDSEERRDGISRIWVRTVLRLVLQVGLER